jgi:hypothetical protein
MKNSLKNSENVKNIIKEMNQKENNETAQIKIEEVISEDMNKQETDFKKKLDEKRKKIALSTSDVMDQVNVIVIIFFNLIVLIFKFLYYF